MYGLLTSVLFTIGSIIFYSNKSFYCVIGIDIIHKDPQNQVRLLISLDLSYAAVQTTHSALILLLQAVPDSTRSRSEKSDLTSQSHLFHTLTLVQNQI